MAYDNSLSVAQKIVEGLQEFTDALESGKPVSEQMTCRKVVLKLKPTAYSPECVKQIRGLLKVSQPLFAQFLGVSTKTVQKWERGEEAPRPIACRFMDEIRSCPEHWRARLAKCIEPAAGPC